MKLDDLRRSSNVEDRRGLRFPGGGGGLGLGAIVLALVAAYFGIDPRVVLDAGSPLQGDATQQQAGPVQETAAEAQVRELVTRVLGSTEDVWSDLFSRSGMQYRDPTLVLYRDATPTRCGTGQSAMGPFYCPVDEKVYIDLGFYDELQRRFQAPGDFAEAYVVAHEVGHHVQKLLGVSEQVQRARQQASDADSNALSVKLELQADCLAGVWAFHANQTTHMLEAGDVEEALTAAAAVGDDTLQKQTRGYVVPDSFTHGSAAQRVHWFRQGMAAGRIDDCDTFASPDA